MNRLLFTEQHRKTYLVMHRLVVIAQDIAATISDHDPAAMVITAHSVPDAEVALRDVHRLAHAFVAQSPDAFEGSALQSTIRALGGHCVLIGDEAEDLGETQHWKVLQQPFTPAVVIGLIDPATAQPLDSTG